MTAADTLRRAATVLRQAAEPDWQPGDPLYTPVFGSSARPIFELKDDHWCGETCIDYGPSAARWPVPMFGHALDAASEEQAAPMRYGVAP